MPKRSTSGSRVTAFDDVVSRAGAEGTARYAQRAASEVAVDFFRTIDDLTTSSIGVGTYLGDSTDDEDVRYAAVVRQALRRGINVIDTAINYRCQRSERTVGSAIGQTLEAGELSRDELIVCSKGGYLPLDGVPPATRSDYDRYVRAEFFEAGVMAPDDLLSGGHSMAPGFLRYCIGRSRANLRLRTIDIYYLHNPEHQLAFLTPISFRERVRAAFMVFEDAVTRGDIAAYGCATWNGLRAAPDAKGHLSLADLVSIAREIAGNYHHFRVVQLPINLAMTEAIREPTQRLPSGTLVSVLDAAQALGIDVVASASLMQAQLTRGLPEAVHELFPAARTDAQRALSFVRSLPIATALVGMRSLDHLRENLEIVAPRAS
jgi:aryl-alcohol dehydrogenase-like predicted oxidoreductase